MIKFTKNTLKISRFYFSQTPNNEEVNFGFRKVNINEKQGHVDNVFHSVASKYDLMNDVMSFGIHRCWKSTFIEDLGTLKPQRITQNDQLVEVPLRVLDVAGGTGDIALKILEKFYGNQHQYLHKTGLSVTVLDINQSMLDVGKARANEIGLGQNHINFVQGNAEELPYEDNTFDIYTISFGLRNVPRTEKALSEAFRVLKKGGKFQCLEFSKVQNPILSELNRIYQFTALPLMGQFIANDRNAYQYLVESIDKFLSQDELLELLQKVGFSYANYKNLTDGVVAIHSGFKL